MKMRFQKPTMDSDDCVRLIPLYVWASLMARTCITLMRISIIRSEVKKQGILHVSRGVITVGCVSCYIKLLKVIIGLAM
ncbi:hypothetical protein BGW80DRAFT_1347225 [Lactifluus volemus]|nr:hypothetical protein BGW80DRAFT_1347225 [Lactifluus volemus]